ncbi:hypothetical protein H8356DRAFT_942401, partial [Neocallimastix lanati (nom. inval.)]
KSRIDDKTNKFSTLLNKISSIYLFESLRYSHKECDNNMYIDINQPNLINNYYNPIHSNQFEKIFEKFKFSLMEVYSVNPFPFLNSSLFLYILFLKVTKFL